LTYYFKKNKNKQAGNGGLLIWRRSTIKDIWYKFVWWLSWRIMMRISPIVSAVRTLLNCNPAKRSSFQAFAQPSMRKKRLKSASQREALKIPLRRLEGGMHGMERSKMEGVSPEVGQRVGSRQRSCRGGANGCEI